MTQEIKWKEYFDSFSKLSLPNQKRYLSDTVDHYTKLVERVEMERVQLNALLNFIGHKSEKRKQWSLKLKNLLDQLPEVVQNALSKTTPTDDDYRK